VQFEFFLKPTPSMVASDFLTVGSRQVPMVLVRTRRARRYVLRLRADGVARVTIPRGGSVGEARRFAERNCQWLERQLQRLAAQPKRPAEWSAGTEILLRGEPVKIEAGVNGESGIIRFGGSSRALSPPRNESLPSVLAGGGTSLSGLSRRRALAQATFVFASLTMSDGTRGWYGLGPVSVCRNTSVRALARPGSPV
jgi:hypothetical protein